MALGRRIADIAVLIVGFRNPTDIAGCLSALSTSAREPNFDIFICENGGLSSYQDLLQTLLAPQGPCELKCELEPSWIMTDSMLGVQRLRLRVRPSDVWVGCATDNLGYAGGINAWLSQLQYLRGWKGVWVLNPDTEPESNALSALVERADAGKKGMVGSTIIDYERPDKICCRGGLHWQKLAARTVAIGYGEDIKASYDLCAIEDAMDSPSGASIYITRTCLERVGFMDESYFLFFEDLDWGLRAKPYGLGYASASIVRHKRGTTTGTARRLADIPRRTSYLEYRNGIRFVLRHFPWTLPIRIIVSILYAGRFLIYGSRKNCFATLEGMLAGLIGMAGRPAA